MISTIGQHYILRIYISSLSGRPAGYSEVYHLRRPDIGDAWSDAKDIVAIRRHLLSSSAQITYAAMHRTERYVRQSSEWAADQTRGRDAWFVLGDAPGLAATCNDASVGIRVRIETRDGRWSQRRLHFVPDEYVQGNRLIDQLAGVGVGLADAAPNLAAMGTPGTLAHFVNSLRAYGYYMLHRVVAARPAPPQGSELRWSYASPERVLVAGLGSRRPGRPFGLSRGQRRRQRR